MTKARIIRALQFLRIMDMQGNLSLTNLCLMAALVRALMLPQVTLPDLALFIGSIVSYQAKRWMQPTTTDASADLQAAVAALQTKVTALQLSNQQTGRRSP